MERKDSESSHEFDSDLESERKADLRESEMFSMSTTEKTQRSAKEM